MPAATMCLRWILLSALVSSFPSALAELQHYRVAALFESKHEALSLTFQNAMSKMNVRNVIGSNRKLLYHVENLDSPDDSFEANKKVCRQLKEGIAAVFGPISEVPRVHIQSLCSAFDIPHLQAQWDPREQRGYYSINLYPDTLTLSKGQAELIEYFEWKQFTVIYEDNESLIRLQEILKVPRGKDYKMSVRKLNFFQGGYTTLLKDLGENNEFRIIVDCDPLKIRRFLEEADSLDMLSEYYHYHFTTLDLSLVDLDDYRYKGVNITAMRMIDPQRPEVMEIMAEWTFMQSSKSAGRSPLMGQRAITTEMALMYDAVQLFARALAQLAQPNFATQPLSCGKKEAWAEGSSLLNYMKSTTFEGLSGRIVILNDTRRDFDLDITKLEKDGVVKVGTWHRSRGINITVSYKDKQLDDLERLRNKTLRVVTVYDEPYVFKRKTPDENGTMHEGFIVDLLDLLADRLGFKYEMHEQAERVYASYVNGKWGGLVGDLMHRDNDKRPDLAAGGMTITYDRAKVVDFTTPFLNLGITIIYKKPSAVTPDLFSFLSPLDINVWIYMLAAYLCVSFMLFIIARFTPYEWENPHPCDVESEEVENQFTILNSLWFTIGSLMQQGSEVAPKAISTRAVACLWWFFTMIIISSYTANLAAFLTVKRMDAPIKNADDLSKQMTIKYGTLEKGSTINFFRTSNVTTFKRMWSFMSANADTVLVPSNHDGFEKVKHSNYAFLGESTTVDYQVQRNCELMQIGDLLDNKGYGIAAPKASPYIDLISKEIVYLQEKQFIQKLYTKWWKDKSTIRCNADDEEKVKSNALGLENVGGVFILLVGGSLTGLLIAFMEFLWKVWKNSREDKQTFLSEMAEELRFILRCKSTRNDVKTPNAETTMDNGVAFTSIPNKTNRDG